MPELNEPPELADALREHFARDVRRTGFAPITAAEIRQAATTGRRRSGLAWLAVAAALAVLVPSGIIAAQLLSRAVPAVPVPSEIVTATPGTPTETHPAGWFRRVTGPVAVAGYAQANLDDLVYLIAARPKDGSCQLEGYRYHPAVDIWQALPEGPAYPGECTTPQVFARGGGLDVVVADGPQLYRYAAGSSTWRTLPVPEADTCDPVGLEAGVFCLAGHGLEYRFYDANAARWREGDLDLGLDGEPTTMVDARRVERAGREAVLIVALRGSGELATASWDPVSRLLEPVSSHPGTGHQLAEIQTTADGFAAFVMDDPSTDTALILEVDSGGWRTVEIPRPGGRIFHEQPSDAAWVLRVFPDAADRVVLHGYLYRPSDGSWSAVAPLPPVELGTEPHDWVGASGVCRRAAPFNCWGLSVGGLAEVLTEVDPAAIAASNRQPR